VSTDAEVVTRQLLDAWNARDVPSYVGLMTEDVEWDDPAMPQPPARGRAAVQAFSESVLRAFPDFRYEILGPLGRGGMGMVYRAFDRELGETVAIKVLRPDVARESGRNEQRFRSEIRLARRVRHRNTRGRLDFSCSVVQYLTEDLWL
jgi:serine/threonine protein kinase